MAEEPEPDLGVAEGSEEQAMEMPSWKAPENIDPQVGVFHGRQRLIWASLLWHEESPGVALKNTIFDPAQTRRCVCLADPQERAIHPLPVGRPGGGVGRNWLLQTQRFDLRNACNLSLGQYLPHIP